MPIEIKSPLERKMHLKRGVFNTAKNFDAIPGENIFIVEKKKAFSKDEVIIVKGGLKTLLAKVLGKIFGLAPASKVFLAAFIAFILLPLIASAITPGVDVASAGFRVAHGLVALGIMTISFTSLAINYLIEGEGWRKFAKILLLVWPFIALKKIGVFSSEKSAAWVMLFASAIYLFRGAIISYLEREVYLTQTDSAWVAIIGSVTIAAVLGLKKLFSKGKKRGMIGEFFYGIISVITWAFVFGLLVSGLVLLSTAPGESDRMLGLLMTMMLSNKAKSTKESLKMLSTRLELGRIQVKAALTSL